MADLRYAVSFRVTHPGASLSAIAGSLTEVFGAPPTLLWAAGSPRRSFGQRVLPGIHAESACSFDCPHDGDTDLPQHLAACLRLLTTSRAALQEIVRTGGQLGFFIGLFADGNVGETLDRVLLRDLGDWQIDLELDIYGERLAAAPGDGRGSAG